MSAMLIVEKCACGASIDLSGESFNVTRAVVDWRKDHKHETPQQPRPPVLLGSRQPRMRRSS